MPDIVTRHEIFYTPFAVQLNMATGQWELLARRRDAIGNISEEVFAVIASHAHARAICAEIKAAVKDGCKQGAVLAPCLGDRKTQDVV